jgi:plasmid maintenance system antidote protein VapI
LAYQPKALREILVGFDFNLGDRLTKHLLDENDVLRLLHEVVDRAGSQSAWARRSGVDRTQLNNVLRGKRRLSPTIIQALKLKKVVAYERK